MIPAFSGLRHVETFYKSLLPVCRHPRNLCSGESILGDPIQILFLTCEPGKLGIGAMAPHLPSFTALGKQVDDNARR